VSDRRLTIVSRPQGNNRAVLDGSAPVEGIELEVIDVPVLVHGFRRMVRDLEFDVSEMALTTYLCAKDHGAAFTALPIFLVRGLHHAALFRRRGSNTAPADLAGARVGISRGYTVTTGVWARAILDEEFDVDPRGVTWVPSGDEHVEDFEVPPNVLPEPGLDLGQALADGHLDAAIGTSIGHEDVEPLFADPIEAGMRSLTERGLYPINHCIVVRDDLLTSDPSIANRLYQAFRLAKDRYVDALLAGPEPTDPSDALYRRIALATHGDPLPYGLEPNRATLERLVAHAVKQGIIRTPPDLDALFIDPDTAGQVQED
jgi:4,5-dihydroxyphthalate decarboxylase